MMKTLDESNIELERQNLWGDFMLLEHWLDCVKDGIFTDYDGHGNLSTKHEMSNLQILPSFVENGILFKVMIDFKRTFRLTKDITNKFKYIIWFNK